MCMYIYVCIYTYIHGMMFVKNNYTQAIQGLVLILLLNDYIYINLSSFLYISVSNIIPDIQFKMNIVCLEFGFNL